MFHHSLNDKYMYPFLLMNSIKLKYSLVFELRYKFSTLTQEIHLNYEIFHNYDVINA